MYQEDAFDSGFQDRGFDAEKTDEPNKGDYFDFQDAKDGVSNAFGEMSMGDNNRKGGGRGGGRGGGGGGDRSCYQCGESGHMSRECPSNPKKGNDGACYKCGESGHMSRQCPQNEGGAGKGGDNNCFKCGEGGHFARECPTAGDAGGEDKKCFNCQGTGHFAKECTEEAAPADPNRPPIYVPPPPPEDDDMFAASSRGVNFDKYDKIPVEVSGVNPPAFIREFDEAGLPEQVRANVAKAGYEKPTPVQKYGIPIINHDRDIMACAQTGSGKTAAFLLPVLSKIIKSGVASSEFSVEQTPQAIIVGPTRELVNQIYLEARKFSRGTIVRPVVAYGGTSTSHQLRDLAKGCSVLIATPGRLMDFIKRGKVSLSKVQYVILDEADRMLDMGFESEIRTLVSSPGMASKTERHTLMFSATFPDEIQKLAHEFLQDDFIYLTVGMVGGACADVEQTIMQVDQMDKRDQLIKLLEDVKVTRARTLVFVETKRNADFIACFLSQNDFPTTSIHGDRLQQQREEALRDFKCGECPILVATSVAARGLDIPMIEHVVNYDIPKSIDEYVHRIGRTGRCGNQGKATSFYDNSKDFAIARSLIKTLSNATQTVPDWLQECGQHAIGTGFGSASGDFANKDARKRKGGNSGGNFGQEEDGGFRAKEDLDYNDGGGGFGDEDW